MFLLALAALAAAATEDAPAGATASTPAPAPVAAAPAKPSKADMVCRTEQVTGSRFPKRVCYSKAEYDAQRQIEQDRLRQSQSGGLIRGN